MSAGDNKTDKDKKSGDAKKTVSITVDVPIGEEFDGNDLLMSAALKTGFVGLQINFIWEETEMHNYSCLMHNAEDAVNRFVDILQEHMVLPYRENDTIGKYEHSGDAEFSLEVYTNAVSFEFAWNGDKPKKGDATISNINIAGVINIVSTVYEAYKNYRNLIESKGIFIQDHIVGAYEEAAVWLQRHASSSSSSSSSSAPTTTNTTSSSSSSSSTSTTAAIAATADATDDSVASPNKRPKYN